MTPMTNRVKVQKYFWGLIIGTNNFVFEVKFTRGLEDTHSESRDGQPNGRKKPDIEVAYHLKISHINFHIKLQIWKQNIETTIDHVEVFAYAIFDK